MDLFPFLLDDKLILNICSYIDNLKVSICIVSYKLDAQIFNLLNLSFLRANIIL